MQVGEHAGFVSSQRAATARGSIATRWSQAVQPRYEVEPLSIGKETELWDMSFDEKMKLAAERRQRGNTLVGGGHFLMADAEYEQALRYLIFMPHPEPEQTPLIADAITAVHLNLAATKLRLGDEQGAIKNANDALGKCDEGARAYISKAHYRLAQAYTQLGKYALSQRHLDFAEEAAEGDAAAVDGIRKERERLSRRQQKHQRDRRKAAERMVHGGAGDAEEATDADDAAAADDPKISVGPVAWVRSAPRPLRRLRVPAEAVREVGCDGVRRRCRHGHCRRRRPPPHTVCPDHVAGRSGAANTTAPTTRPNLQGAHEEL